MDVATASGFAVPVVHAGGTSVRVGPGSGGGSQARSTGAVADDTAGCGSEYGSGVCDHHRRCGALSARQAGGQLSRPDPERTQFGEQAQAGSDLQTRQCISPYVVGRSGTVGSAA